MGEVWRARHRRTNERVAIKVLLAELAKDENLQKRFLREARAASAVKHPNVVELREVHEAEDGAPFLVMELLEGETLGRRLKRKGALSLAETACIVLPILDAVDAAHAVGLVHRDLKPENVFLAREARNDVSVRVLDFGIAKKVEKLATPTTPSGPADNTAPAATTSAMLGTPYYMAPEQALGEKDIDARADVWSLGIMLYECLTGVRPTEAATLGAILKIVVTDGIEPIAKALPELDASLGEAIMHMLRSNRSDRAASLGEVRAALERVRDPTLTLAIEVSDEEPPAPSLATPPKVSKRGRILVPSALAVALVAGVVVTRIDRQTTKAGASERASVVAVSPPPSPMPSASETASSAASPSPLSPRAAPARASAVSSSDAHPRASANPAVTNAPSATSSKASELGRGPSGLVTDNPFGPTEPKKVTP